jgi:ribosome-binding factor A
MSGVRRPQRLAEQIREEVTLIIAGELEDPRLASVTVTEVKLNPDMRHARIFVSVSGTEQEVKASLAALNHAAGFIRHQLNAALRMKRTPELQFVYDQTDESAARIEQLLIEEVKEANERQARETAEQDAEVQGGALA